MNEITVDDDSAARSQRLLGGYTLECCFVSMHSNMAQEDNAKKDSEAEI